MSEKDLVELYRKLYKITLKEKEMLDGDAHYSKVMELLVEKDELMDEIEKIDVQKYFESLENPDLNYQEMKELIRKSKELEDENIKNLKSKEVE